MPFFIDISPIDKMINGKDVKKYDELVLLTDLMEYKIIVIPSRTEVKKLDLLFQMGIEWKQIILSESWALYLGGKRFDLYDSLVGYSRKGDLSGFTVFEDKNNKSLQYTIVTLGGSTADPSTSNIISWSEFLYNHLKDMKINARVICGGLSSYHSGQEFIKLFRDVLPMRPDMVISYSGINDTPYFWKRHVCKSHPYVMMHQEDFLKYSMKHALRRGYFYGAAYHGKVSAYTLGLEEDTDLSHKWVQNERMMHALCEEFGIKFYAFLQPNRDYGGYVKTGEPEKSSYAKNLSQNVDEVKAWYDKTRSLIGDKEYIIDLSELFAGAKHVYYDYCHVFESGNRKIEAAILRHIIKDIRNGIRNK